MVVPLLRAEEITKKEVVPVKKEEAPAKIPLKRAPEIPIIEAEEILPEKISKEPVGARPIIPVGNTCCVGVCTYLNKDIDTMSQALKIRQDELKFLGPGPAKMKTRKGITALTNKMSALKDIRFTLADKGVCTCIEMPKFPVKELPKV